MRDIVALIRSGENPRDFKGSSATMCVSVPWIGYNGIDELENTLYYTGQICDLNYDWEWKNHLKVTLETNKQEKKQSKEKTVSMWPQTPLSLKNIAWQFCRRNWQAIASIDICALKLS